MIGEFKGKTVETERLIEQLLIRILANAYLISGSSVPQYIRGIAPNRLNKFTKVSISSPADTSSIPFNEPAL